MESQNFYSVLADKQEEVIKDNSVHNNIQEIFFNTFSALTSGALETLLQGFCQRLYDDQIAILVNTFGERAHSKNYQSLSQHLADPDPLILLLFNLSEQAAKEAFIPVYGYLDCLMDKTLTVNKNPEIEDHSREDMDDIIIDTNQQSSRIILEVPPKSTPIIATSLTMITKSGNDKLREKTSLSQPKGGKDRPNSGQKSSDKMSRKIEKVLVMQDIPTHLRNTIRDVTLYDIPAT
ncbi:hypothetical protein RCL_jg13083.t1 [Rhizophagus clarus]|nr:hypothetical protein RCL_jg13083.t1 [Rhizophagus clarus]